MKFGIIIIHIDNSFSILLNKNSTLFTNSDGLVQQLLEINKYNHFRTQKDNIHWIQINNPKNQDYIQSDLFKIIQDDFKQPLDYMISNEYNIEDQETRYWLDYFQSMFIGYQPDTYENISQDSYS